MAQDGGPRGPELKSKFNASSLYSCQNQANSWALESIPCSKTAHTWDPTDESLTKSRDIPKPIRREAAES